MTELYKAVYVQPKDDLVDEEIEFESNLIEAETLAKVIERNR